MRIKIYLNLSTGDNKRIKNTPHTMFIAPDKIETSSKIILSAYIIELKLNSPITIKTGKIFLKRRIVSSADFDLGVTSNGNFFPSKAKARARMYMKKHIALRLMFKNTSLNPWPVLSTE